MILAYNLDENTSHYQNENKYHLHPHYHYPPTNGIENSSHYANGSHLAQHWVCCICTTPCGLITTRSGIAMQLPFHVGKHGAAQRGMVIA